MSKPTNSKPSPNDARATPKSEAETGETTDGPARKTWKRASSVVSEGTLQPFALVWIKSLPALVKPLKCARQYPRVLNKIAALWNLHERCIDYLDELLVDTRGQRAGFPPGVNAELRRLKSYRLSLRPREARDTDFGQTEPLPLDWPITKH